MPSVPQVSVSTSPSNTLGPWGTWAGTFHPRVGRGWGREGMQSPWVTMGTGGTVRAWCIGRKVPLGEPPPPITTTRTLSASPSPSETTEAAALGRMLSFYYKRRNQDFLVPGNPVPSWMTEPRPGQQTSSRPRPHTPSLVTSPLPPEPPLCQPRRRTKATVDSGRWAEGTGGPRESLSR